MQPDQMFYFFYVKISVWKNKYSCKITIKKNIEHNRIECAEEDENTE